MSSSYVPRALFANDGSSQQQQQQPYQPPSYLSQSQYYQYASQNFLSQPPQQSSSSSSSSSSLPNGSLANDAGVSLTSSSGNGDDSFVASSAAKPSSALPAASSHGYHSYEPTPSRTTYPSSSVQFAGAYESQESSSEQEYSSSVPRQRILPPSQATPGRNDYQHLMDDPILMSASKQQGGISGPAGSSSVTKLSMSSLQTTNSKAVLSALRALQEKIRKLESEKAFYQEQYEKTRKSAADFREEIEKAHDAERRRSSEMIRLLEIERDGLRKENADLSVSSAVSREQAKALEKDLSYQRQVASTADAEKRLAEARANELDKHLKEVEAQLAQSTSQSNQLQDHTEQLSEALDENTRARRALEEERSKLEVAIREMVRINSSLVDKMAIYESTLSKAVSSASASGAAGEKKKKTAKKSSASGSSSSAPPAAKRSATPSSSSMSAAAASRIQAAMPAPSSSAAAAAAAVASALSNAMGGVSSSFSHHNQSAHTIPSSPSMNNPNIRDRLKRANKGKDVPFLLGKSSAPSFSTVANVQNQLSYRDMSPDPHSRAPGVRSSLSSSFSVPIGAGGVSSSFSRQQPSEEEQDIAPLSASAHHGVHSGSNAAGHGDVRSSLDQLLSSSHHELSSASAAAQLADVEAGTPAAAEMNIEAVIEQMESEYRQLNTEYHQLLTKASDSVSLSQDEFHITSSLRNILDRMERKAVQLKELRRYRYVMTEQLREAQSPPRVPGAQKRVKALQLYKDLKTLN